MRNREVRSASQNSSSEESGTINQEHGRTSQKLREKSMHSVDTNTEEESGTSRSVTDKSLSSSISRFRNDFEELKCKMKIFGESLNLCQCIAADFKSKLSLMEKRLQALEKRQIMWRSESNYSAIIAKNKRLSTKTMNAAKTLKPSLDSHEYFKTKISQIAPAVFEF